MMDYFMLAIGAYIFYAGITGKGNMMYKDETIHRSEKAKFFKMMRLFGLVAGPLCIASSILTIQNQKLIGNIIAAVFFVVLMVIIVQTMRMTDKHIKKRCAKLGLPEPESDGFAEARAAKNRPSLAPTSNAVEPAAPEENLDATTEEPPALRSEGARIPYQEKRTVDQDDIRFF